MKEVALHWIWEHRVYGGLVPCSSGMERSIVVLNTGVYNRDSGPDFFNAQIRIGSITWAGNVEIHIRSSEWLRHSHQHDPAYDNVVLHVVLEYDAPIYHRTTGEELMTVRMLPCPSPLEQWDTIGQGKPLSLRCASFCREHRFEMGQTVLQALGLERLERKKDEMLDMYYRVDQHWDSLTYVYLLRYLGLSLNSQAMELLALHLPLKCLYKHRNSLLQLQALLLGVAHLLSTVPEDGVRVQLEREYAFLREKYSLETLPEGTFRRARIRPQALPERKLLQLATLVYRSDFFAQGILSVSSLEDLSKSLHVGGQALLSVHQQQILMLNLVFPYQWAYSERMALPWDRDRALQVLKSLSSESNRHIQEWRCQMGTSPANALEGQGCIELQTRYCACSKCFLCPIGRKIYLSTVPSTSRYAAN